MKQFLLLLGMTFTIVLVAGMNDGHSGGLYAPRSKKLIEKKDCPQGDCDRDPGSDFNSSRSNKEPEANKHLKETAIRTDKGKGRP